jgi:hypothetical protein
MVRGGLKDANRVGEWVGDVGVAVSNEVLIGRMDFVGDLRKEIKIRLFEARQRKTVS